MLFRSIFIIRTFIRIRELLASSKELALRVERLEGEVNDITRYIDELNDQPIPPKHKLGFTL